MCARLLTPHDVSVFCCATARACTCVFGTVCKCAALLNCQQRAAQSRDRASQGRGDGEIALCNFANAALTNCRQRWNQCIFMLAL